MARRVGCGHRANAGGPPPLPVVTCVCCALLVIAALFGNWLAPYAKEAVSLGASLLPPAWQTGGSMQHLLGTDQLGRDILSRLIAGARISLATAAAATLVSGVFGVLVGLVAGYVGGILESVAMRVVDAFLALPFILLALALVATLGTGFGNIIMVMVIANWARYARLVRSEVLIGEATRLRHAGAHCRRAAAPSSCCGTCCPTSLNSVVVLAILDVGRAIILESSLSFLGVGIQPPDVSWGLMLADGRTLMGFAWWLTTLPGLMIVFAVLSFNSLGRWMHVALRSARPARERQSAP